MISQADRAAAVDSARAAAAAGDDILVCPYAAQKTPRERALARIWVAAYLAVAPPAAGDVDYDDARDAAAVDGRLLERRGGMPGRRWTPETHPRWPAGDRRGGRFARAGGAGAGGLPSRPGGPGAGQPVTPQPSARQLLETGASGDMDRLRAQWASVLDGQYAGLHVRTVSAGPWDVDSGSAVLATAEVYDANGMQVGKVADAIVDEGDGPYAVLGLLKLDPQVQGGGFAGEFTGHLEDWYRDAGVRHAELYANIDVGGYAWARAGFDFKDATDAAGIVDRLDTIAGQLEGGRYGRIPAERVADQLAAADAVLGRTLVASFGDPGYPSAYEISQAGRWPGATRDDWWIGKVTLMGSSWNGVKPL